VARLDAEKADAKKRQIESGKQHGRGKVKEPVPYPIADTGQSRDKAGAAVGVSGKAIDMARLDAEKAETRRKRFRNQYRKRLWNWFHKRLTFRFARARATL